MCWEDMESFQWDGERKVKEDWGFAKDLMRAIMVPG